MFANECARLVAAHKDISDDAIEVIVRAGIDTHLADHEGLHRTRDRD